ncbi:MAG TPA: M4 family metallopeptidase [Solirubrobacteraceae bacterium]|jgi:Zn-dependent metalloprotease
MTGKLGIGALVAVALGAAAAAQPAAAAPTGPAVDRAREAVRADAARTHFGPNQALVARDVVVDRDGQSHVRFDRTYAGLPVLGGDLVAHAGAGFSQTLDDDLDLSTRPQLSAGEARRRAGADRATLLVYARSGAPRLAWDTLRVGEDSELHVILDAATGAELDRFDDVKHVGGTGNGFFNGPVALETTAIGGGFSLTDPSRGGQYTCDMGNKQQSRCTTFTDADNAWGTGLLSDRASTAVDAQYGTAVTWDYYKAVHNRSGIGNDGKGSYNRVHYSRSYNNASWSDSCFCMTYGDGDGTTYHPFDSLDVAGHEMSHGVTSRTADLVYSGESGGLNEATSDIFGTLVEFYAGNTRDAGDYKIGEKLYRSNPGEAKALRYMYQPSLDGASKDCWYAGVGSLNVHYSSGPANHFFYLLAQGSAPTAYAANGSPTCGAGAVTGIGNDAAGAIWYRALTVYMTSSTTYAGARTAALNAARDLYGAGSAQESAVAAAWAGAGVR